MIPYESPVASVSTQSANFLENLYVVTVILLASECPNARIVLFANVALIFLYNDVCFGGRTAHKNVSAQIKKQS